MENLNLDSDTEENISEETVEENNDNINNDDDMLGLKRESFITVLSTRRSGKSFLIANLIYNFLTGQEDNRVDLLYMFSNTAKFEQGGRYDFIDKKVIFKANPDNCAKIVRRLMQIQLETKKKKHILLVFDDIDLSAKYSDSIERLATQGRHYNITTILSAQVATIAISPAIRNNTSYLFFRKLNSSTLKNQIYQMIIQNDYESPEHFKEFVNANINDFQFIFYNNDSDEKGLSIIKASEIPSDFKYKVKEPPKQEKKQKPQKYIGWGQPINISYLNSEGQLKKPKYVF